MAGDLARRLRETREYVGIERVDAAVAVGMTESELEAIEHGERQPDDLELERLARAYGYMRRYFASPVEPLDEATVAVVARLGDCVSEHDRREAMLFAAYLRDAADD